jgi:hypothetical protein
MARNAAVRPPPQFYRRFRTLAGGAKWYRGALQPFALIARMAPKGVQKVYRQKRQGRRSFAEGVKTPGAMLSRPQSEENPPGAATAKACLPREAPMLSRWSCRFLCQEKGRENMAPGAWHLGIRELPHRVQLRLPAELHGPRERAVDCGK